MIINLKKIDALIVVALVVIASFVLYNAGYIDTDPNPEPPVKPIVVEEENETESEPIPPESLDSQLGYIRAVTPEDEGKHFDKLRISREQWYYTVIFDDDSELAGWTATISFNHMAWGDLLGTLKPDLMVVTLHGPNGKEYGGVINKKRGLGIFEKPTLEADAPGVSVTYDNSWAEGMAPNWHVHIEDDDIDEDHDIKMDLDFFAPSDPYWTYSEKIFQKSESNLASYVFLGCNVTGEVTVDGDTYLVKGIGHHEHTWTPNIVTKGMIKEWDWCQITLENGWNIYYSNYKIRHTLLDTKETQFNPFGAFIITTNQGKTLTVLDDIEVTVKKSDSFDDKIFLFVKMPSSIHISAKPSGLQVLTKSYNIEVELNIKPENTYEKVWKLPTYVGMKIGRSIIDGKITWTDNEGVPQEVELNGLGSMWNMRALI